MGKLFSELVSEDLINDWAQILDWLFDERKFLQENNWNGGYVAAYTKEIKKIPGLSDKENGISIVTKQMNVKHQYPNQEKKFNRKKPNIVMKSNESIARDLIRHIRNGIAHGHTKIERVQEGKLFIEILDYSDSSLSPDKQTAFIWIPIEYISEFHKLYEQKNKAIMNTRTSNREARKKSGKRKRK